MEKDSNSKVIVKKPKKKENEAASAVSNMTNPNPNLPDKKWVQDRDGFVSFRQDIIKCKKNG